MRSSPRRRGFLDELRDRCDVEVADDLREVELGGEACRRQGNPPAARRRRTDWPSRRASAAARAAGSRVAAPTHAPRSAAADGPVAAEHDERREPVLPGLLGVAQTEVERMLASSGTARRARAARRARGCHEVTEVVFFLRADRAVCQEHRRRPGASACGRRGTCRSRRPCLRTSRAPPAAGAAPPRSRRDPD